MGIALEDIGLFMLKEIALDAAIRLHSGLQGANWAVGNQLKNGNNSILHSHQLCQVFKTKYLRRRESSL